MAFSINKAYLVGNVVSEPELRYTPGGQPVATFRIATNRSIKDKNTDNWKDIATFHTIVVWGKIAEWLSNNLPKGGKVCVEGRIENRSYEKDGIKRYITEIIAENVIPMAGKKNAAPAQQPAGRPTPAGGSTVPNAGTDAPAAAAGTTETPPTDTSEEVAPDDIPF